MNHEAMRTCLECEVIRPAALFPREDVDTCLSCAVAEQRVIDRAEERRRDRYRA